MDLYQSTISKLYRSYLIPTLLAMLSNSLYCLVDVYFISKGAGSIGLAALNIAMPVFTIYSAIGLLFGVGGATVMSVAEGQKNRNDRNQAFTMCLVMMCAIGFGISIISTLFVKEFAYLLGASDELLPYVIDYMTPIQMVSVAFIIMYSSSILLRSDHAPQLAMHALMFGNISNMVLDYLFVMVFDMGILGASIATALSPVLTILWILPCFIKRKNKVQFVKKWYDTAILNRICSAGMGSGIMELSAGCVIIMFNGVILNMGGEAALSAYAVITNIAYVLKGLLNGFAQASQPIISANYGAGLQERVRAALFVSLKLSIVFSAAVYLIFFLFPEEISMIFAKHDPEVAAISNQGIRLYFTSLVFTAFNTVMMYYYQSIEAGRFSTVLAVLKGFVFIIASLFLFSSLFGLTGVWLTVTAAEGMSVLICIWYSRFSKSSKKAAA